MYLPVVLLLYYPGAAQPAILVLGVRICVLDLPAHFFGYLPEKREVEGEGDLMIE